MLRTIERNWELVVIFVLATVLTGLIAALPNFIEIYKSNALDSTLLQFAGVLFGLLLTAYAILFGLIPIVEKDVLKAPSFNRINRNFVWILRFIVLAVIISILIFFLTGIYQTALVYTQLWLSFTIIMWGFLLTVILADLFNYVKKLRIEGQS
jgi:hypothetical protein